MTLANGRNLSCPDFCSISWYASFNCGNFALNSFAVILDTTSTCVVLVSVLHLANSADVFVLNKIICTAWRRMQYTSAGSFLFFPAEQESRMILKQARTFLRNVVRGAWCLWNWYDTPVDWGYVHRTARDIPVHQGKFMQLSFLSYAETQPQLLVLTRWIHTFETMWRCLFSCLVAKRLRCVRVIPPAKTEHSGPHTHSNNQKVFHFCTETLVVCTVLQVQCQKLKYFP